LAVLIKEGDAASEAIGLAYQKARGIPDANMVRVAVNSNSDAIGVPDFADLKARLDARLPASVQATLVTWTQPSRVQGNTAAGAPCSMGITSALAFGYNANRCGGCVATPNSPYFDSKSSKPFTDLGVRPSMLLGAGSLAQAQALIARGVAADGSLVNATAASGSGYFVRTDDAARSVRWPDMQLAAAVPVPGITLNLIDNVSGTGSNVVTNTNNVMFYLTGLERVPQLETNRYLPGAVADHLTSAGGVLPNGAGQMPITDWLQGGATASYGTVEEPCNFTSKFPRASVLLRHYAAGESLIEAYWKSVEAPGQGLFVGEPLARPWGR
jgi:uncharacterized protein (TIGR03790 family)